MNALKKSHSAKRAAVCLSALGASGSSGDSSSRVSTRVQAEGGSKAVSKIANKNDRMIDSSANIPDPYGTVDGVMTDGCASIRRDARIRDLVPLLEKYSGVPVVDEDGKVVGVVSDKDLVNYDKKFCVGDSCDDETRQSALDKPVSTIMVTPAIVIRGRAMAAYAAGVMLQNKVHRLPVVDMADNLVGMVTRTDIFEPLLCNTDDPNCNSDPIYRKSPSDSGHVKNYYPSAGD